MDGHRYIYIYIQTIFMAKPSLHITISPELIDIAKNSNINLSQEFEQWLKIRLSQSTAVVVDYNLEISKRQEEIEILKAKSQLQDKVKSKEDQRTRLIDSIINGQSNIILSERWKGLQGILRDRMNEILTDEEARSLLNNRLKERGLDA